MDAVPRHDIGLAPEDAGGSFLDIHQLVKREFPARIVEEQIDIGLSTGLAPRGRPEQIDMLDAKLFSSASCSCNRAMASVRPMVNARPFYPQYIAQPRPRCRDPEVELYQLVNFGTCLCSEGRKGAQGAPRPQLPTDRP